MLKKIQKNWDKHNFFLLPIIVFIVAILAFGVIYILYIMPILKLPTGRLYTKGGTPFASRPIDNGEYVEQEVILENECTAILLFFGTYGKSLYNVQVEGAIINAENGEYVEIISGEISEIKDNQYCELPLSEGLVLSEGEIILRLSFTGIKENEQLSIWAQEDDSIIKIGEEEYQGSFMISFQGKSTFLKNYYWVIATFLSFLLALLSWLIFCKKVATQKLFLVAAMGFGILLAFVYTPYSYFDEGSHIPATYYHSARMMGKDNYEKGQFDNRYEDRFQHFNMYAPQREQYLFVYENLFSKDKTPGKVYSEKVVTIGEPYQYFPQALGVSAARVLNWGNVPTLYMGMLFSLVAYVLVVYFAIRITPFKILFTLLGLLPISLRMAASFSYDTSIYALCLFFIAYVLHLSYVKNKMKIWDLVILATVGVLILPLKYIYAPLMLLPLIIPKEKWLKTWLKTIYEIILGATALLALVVFIRFGMNVNELTIGVTPWNDPQGAYTFNWIFLKPWIFARMFFVTAIDGLGEIIRTTGYMQHYNLPAWVSMAILLLLIASVSPKEGQLALGVRRKDKVMFLFLAACVYCLGITAAFPWTFIGSYYIVGSQGRYYLPVLALFILPFYNRLHRQKTSKDMIICSILLINSYAVLYIMLAGFNNRISRQPFL